MKPLSFLLLLFSLYTQIGHLSAITDASDIQALQRVKAAMDPASILPASCLASWDFSMDPCDHKYTAFFTCGFDCEPDNRGVQHVTSLELDSSGYKGFLSPFIGKLTALRRLQMSGNALGGPIPDSIGELSHLTVLDLSSNSLEDNIPKSLGSMPSLTKLNLANNLLGGPIPTTFNSLYGLTELHLDSNKLQGPVPDLSNLKQLQFLDLSNNALTGAFPPAWPPSLWSLALKNNHLSGGLVTNFLTVEQLNVLDLSGNQLTGPIDAALFAHPSMQQINLSYNKFTMLSEPTPSELVENSQIVAIDLSYNILSGALPSFFGRMTKLSSLSLRYNFFTGQIPLEYAQKAVSDMVGNEQLQRLLLDGNYLTGPLPTAFKNLLPGNVVASFVDNCLENCPTQFFFCQGGQQKLASLCRLFSTSP